MSNSTIIEGVAAYTRFGLGVDTFYDRLAQGLYQPLRCSNNAAWEEVELAGDRICHALLSTVERDLSQALVRLDRLEQQQTGVALGNPTGNLESAANFFLAGVNQGYAGTDATRFSSTLLNHPAVQLAAKYSLSGANATVASGFSSGLDAIGYACQRIRSGKAQAFVAGGTETLNDLTIPFVKQHCSLTGRLRPLCDDRDGTVPTAAVGVLYIRANSGTSSGWATAKSNVLGYAASKASPEEPAAATCRRGIDTIRRALWGADLLYSDIDAVFSSANGMAEDELELEILREVFAPSLSYLPVYPMKAVYGECFSASGPLQCITAHYAMHFASGFGAGGNVNWYNGLCQPAYLSRCECALVYSLAPDRSVSALVIGKI